MGRKNRDVLFQTTINNCLCAQNKNFDFPRREWSLNTNVVSVLPFTTGKSKFILSAYAILHEILTFFPQKALKKRSKRTKKRSKTDHFVKKLHTKKWIIFFKVCHFSGNYNTIEKKMAKKKESDNVSIKNTVVLMEKQCNQ